MPASVEFKEVSLREGLTLLHHRSNKWKTEVFRIFFIAPLSRGVAERSLAAYYLRHGHARLRGMDAVARFGEDAYGANFSTFVTKNVDHHKLSLRGIAVAPEFLPRRADPLAKLLGHVDTLLRRPWFAQKSFSAELFESERDNLLRAIDSIKDNKSHYSEQRLLEEMFAGHRFARPAHGFREEVANATTESVIEEFHRLVAEAPIFIYVVSPRSTREITKVARQTLDLPERKPLTRGRAALPAIRGRVRRVVEADEVVQSRLSMGWRAHDYSRRRDGPAAVLADMLLGGSANSMLFHEVREKRSLAYAVGSSFDPGGGFSVVSAGVDPSNVKKVETLVRRQVRRLAEGGFEEIDLQNVLIMIKRQLESVGDSPDAMINFHSGRRLAAREETDPQRLYDRYRRVKPERICAQAAKLALDSVHVLGPEGATR